MASIYVIREIGTGLFLRGDFRTTAFADAKLVSDANDATWFHASDDEDTACLASVPLANTDPNTHLEIVSLSDCD